MYISRHNQIGIVKILMCFCLFDMLQNYYFLFVFVENIVDFLTFY